MLNVDACDCCVLATCTTCHTSRVQVDHYEIITLCPNPVCFLFTGAIFFVLLLSKVETISIASNISLTNHSIHYGLWAFIISIIASPSVALSHNSCI